MSSYHSIDRRLADLATGKIPAGEDDEYLCRLDGIWPLVASQGGDGDTCRAAAAFELSRRRDNGQAFAALNEADIQFLVFKGAATASIYQQRWHRTRADTDILVRPRDFDQTVKLLESLGYRSGSQIPGRLPQGEVSLSRTDEFGVEHVLDIHWRLSNHWRLSAVVSFEDLWDSRQLLEDYPALVYMPSDMFALLVACLHRVSHIGYVAYETDGFVRYEADFTLWILDIHLLAERLDDDAWRALQTLVVSRGMAEVVLNGLARSVGLFGTQLPQSLVEGLSEAKGQVSMKDFRSPLRSAWLNLSALPDWRMRMAFIRQHLFPDLAYMREQYGDEAFLPFRYLERIVSGLAHRLR